MILGIEVNNIKTNHRRNFVAKTCTDNAMWYDTRQDKELGIIVQAQISNDFTDGHRGMARAKRGAKKYLNSRVRFKQRTEIERILKGI